jgi:hypothetical protein
MGEVGDLLGEERAAAAAASREVGDTRLVEEAVDDQLTKTGRDRETHPRTRASRSTYRAGP